MRDPFRSKIQTQLHREAQIGFCVVAVLLGLFTYVAFYRITGRGHQIPNHVRGAAPPREVILATDEPVMSIGLTTPMFDRLPITNSEPRQTSTKKQLSPEVKRDDQVQLASANSFDAAANEKAKPTNSWPQLFDASRTVTSTPQHGPAINEFEPLPTSSPRPTQQTISEAIRTSTVSTFTAPPEDLKSISPVPISLPPTESDSTNRAASIKIPANQRDIALGLLDPMDGHAEPTMAPSRQEQRPPTPAPVDDDGSTYVTQSGESFWSIAQSKYEDGRFFRALYQYNQHTVPDFDNIKPGTRLSIPAREVLIDRWPEDCPDTESQPNASDPVTVAIPESRIYVTQRGDTLWDIASQRLGQASRFSELYRLNQLRLDPHVSHLTPLSQGIRLVLPAQ